MYFEIINKKTGEKVDCAENAATVKPHTGQIYFRGANVSETHEIRLKSSGISSKQKLEAELEEIRLYKEAFDLVFGHMGDLKGGPLKAYILILKKVLLGRQKNMVITNEDFEQFGDHLTRRDYISKACNVLIEKGLVRKVKNDAHSFRYQIT